MLNSFSGIGRLGADPEVTRNNGQVVTNFTLYINEFYKTNNELMKSTHRIPCTCFDRLAEIAAEFLRKGSQIGVRGALKTKQNGTSVVIHVAELEFLSTRTTNEEPIYNERSL